jgi:hypothetical protein
MSAEIRHSRSSLVGFLLVLVAGCANVFRVVGGSWFFSDDLLNFSIAREMGLSWEYLTRSLFGHLEPGHRFANWAFVALDLNWGAVELITVGGFALVALSADWSLRTYSVTPWLRTIAVLLLGFALPLSGSLVWWSATVNCLPSLCASLLMIGLHKRGIDLQSVPAMLLSSLACFVGTLFYEFTPLAVFFIIALHYLPGADQKERQGAAGQRSATMVFFSSFTILQLSYWSYFVLHPYRDEAGAPPAASEFGRYLSTAIGRGYVGSGIGVTPASLPKEVDIISAGGLALFLAILGHSIWRRSWNTHSRVAVGVLLVVIPHMIIVGVARARRDGISAGLELRYYADLSWVAPRSPWTAGPIAMQHGTQVAWDCCDYWAVFVLGCLVSQLLERSSGASKLVVSIKSVGVAAARRCGSARRDPAGLACSAAVRPIQLVREFHRSVRPRNDANW